MKIGLLGGSFNPAHEGHIYISQMACRVLGLDAVWWMIAPKNPDKDSADIAPFLQRYQRALDITSSHPFIKVSDYELSIKGSQKCTQTIYLVKRLKQQYKDYQFVWLCGADSFMGMYRWRMIDEVLRTIPLAVFDRPLSSKGLMFCPIAQRFKKARLEVSYAQSLCRATPPAWMFFKTRLHHASSTAIRERHQQQYDERNKG